VLQRLESKENRAPVSWNPAVHDVYRRAGDLYYSAEYIATFFRRANASDIKPLHILNHILQFYFTFLQENVHPLQGGYFRCKLRRERRGRPAA